MSSCVYALVNPVTADYFYVGQTRTSLQKRYEAHINNARKATKTSRKTIQYINELLLQDMCPYAEVLEEGKWSAEVLCNKEQYWYDFLSVNYILTNSIRPGVTATYSKSNVIYDGNLISKRVKESWSNPQQRASRIQSLKDVWKDNDEARKLASERSKKMWADPDSAVRRAHESPERRAQIRAWAQSEESRPRLLRQAKLMNAKTQCLECGLVSTTAGVANHQRKKHHQGRASVQ